MLRLKIGVRLVNLIAIILRFALRLVAFDIDATSHSRRSFGRNETGEVFEPRACSPAKIRLQMLQDRNEVPNRYLTIPAVNLHLSPRFKREEADPPPPPDDPPADPPPGGCGSRIPPP